MQDRPRCARDQPVVTRELPVDGVLAGHRWRLHRPVRLVPGHRLLRRGAAALAAVEHRGREHDGLGLRHAAALQPDGLLLPRRLPADVLADHPAPLRHRVLAPPLRADRRALPGVDRHLLGLHHDLGRLMGPGRLAAVERPASTATTSSTSWSSSSGCIWSSRRCCGLSGRRRTTWPVMAASLLFALLLAADLHYTSSFGVVGNVDASHRVGLALGPRPDHVPGAVRGRILVALHFDEVPRASSSAGTAR